MRRLRARSLQGEVKLLLEQAAGVDKTEVARVLAKWKKEFAGKKFSPGSADLIRQDRDR